MSSSVGPERKQDASFLFTECTIYSNNYFYKINPRCNSEACSPNVGPKTHLTPSCHKSFLSKASALGVLRI